jgi:peptide/nickel transport system permease protein
MGPFLLRRALASVPVVLLASFLVFLLLDLAPGDVAAQIAGENASTERITEVREELGLNQSLVSRYTEWVGHAVQGDLGRSLLTDQPVSQLISDRLPVTMTLVLSAMALATAIALAAGLLSAARPGGIVDRVAIVTTSVFAAMPPFWLAFLLVLTLAVNRSIFPALGYAPLGDGIGPWFRHIALPAIALAGIPAAEMTRQLRGALVDAGEKDYIVAARAKGLSGRSVLTKHALKNAAIPLVTVFGWRFAYLLGGTAVVESIFVFSGLGSLAVSSVLARDFPVVLGIAVFLTMVVLVVNLLVDAVYGLLDPRVRH